jgi:very-short-patch-repair endonuclease
VARMTSSPAPPADADIATRILDLLGKAPSLKASDIARELGVTPKEVIRLLHGPLAPQLQASADYRWTLKVATAAKTPDVRAARPTTPLGRLCCYYLECLGFDNNGGASCSAARKNGPLDYAELSALPMLPGGADALAGAEPRRLLAEVKAGRGKLEAWIGHPVRLRHHRSAKWQGYLVEPILLWALDEQEGRGDFSVRPGLPILNFSFLQRMAHGGPMAVVEEAARLAEDLGLALADADAPEVDELVLRLRQVRPEWDWKEAPDPDALGAEPPLSAMDEQGIWNRAVLVPVERSPFTIGLESELKHLAGLPVTGLNETALGHWFDGGAGCAAPQSEEPLLEVLPMNLEQRQAVQSALSRPLTVVTGPPGTGKSQVVTNLLVNAAWQGRKVLFASKNNKAVDVVEVRVNGLGHRPVLIRLGSGAAQGRLADYLASMLSGTVTADDVQGYEEGLQRHRLIGQRMQELERLEAETLEARNRVDQFDAAAERHRRLLGECVTRDFDEALCRRGATLGARHLEAVESLDATGRGLLWKLMLPFRRRGLQRRLMAAVEALTPLALELDAPQAPSTVQVDVLAHREWAAELARRTQAALKQIEYRKALATLQAAPSFEELARQHLELAGQLAQNAEGLWRDWVRLLPKKLSRGQRKEIADYAALLQLVANPNDGKPLPADTKKRMRQLQEKVARLFACWAVTSLSARGRIPMDAAHFDLVVIDEASQCDIASALPLLYRARRAVIIGDPKQLKHISSMQPRQEAELQEKYGLLEGHSAWMYSVNSLFDLAASIVEPDDIIVLRDHHRSHADIIEFSNRQFYEGRLRVATRYSRLKRPARREAGICWTNVPGHCIRPGGGGLLNRPEAQALVDELKALLLERSFDGSVGIVTPFRAQVGILEELVSSDDALSAVRGKADLLIDTVHKFQGDERDVMFFSPVLSRGATPGAIGFLRANGNLFNVAITRARGLLHVVGDRAVAETCGVAYLEAFSAHVARLEDSNGEYVRSQGAPKELGSSYPPVMHPERVSNWERVFYEALYTAGVRPIPQYSVEQYDLDFAVIVGEHRLNLEVDGERYHRLWTGDLCVRDRIRNQRMIELGWEVKRFWVYEIRDQMDACVQWVVDWVRRAETRKEMGNLKVVSG